MEIISPKGITYVVKNEIGKDERFRLFECSTETDSVCILKIARRSAWNGLLDREAFLLEEMTQEARLLQEEFAKINKTDKLLNYHYFFPKLLETFVSEEQKGCRISILSFTHVAKSLDDLTPIGHLLNKENVRIDPRSSAWIMGKMLKLLGFTQNQGIVLISSLGLDNVLINRTQHYVMLFDWTRAISGNGNLTEIETTGEIAQVSKEVTMLLGGDLATGALPKDKQLENNLYEKFLKELAAGLYSDADEAHQRFYILIRFLWPRGFHKFATYSTNSTETDSTETNLTE